MSDKRALYEELLPLLLEPTRPDHNGRVWSYCPAHPDGQKHRRRSLSLHPEIGLTCFAGCEFETIIGALRGSRANITPLPPRPKSSKSDKTDSGQLIAIYEYKDTTGDLIAEKARFERPDGSKSFLWRLPGGDWRDGIKAKYQAKDLPLWGAELVAESDPILPVYFVEGEKACQACRSRGLLAVTHPGGASTTDFGESLETLAGRTILLWPDNDPQGRAYMERVAARLRGLAESVSFIAVDVPQKGDAFDYFAAGGKIENLALSAPVETTTEVLADDAIRVTIPTAAGPVSFAFSSMYKTSRSFSCSLAVQLIGPGRAARPYEQRLDLESASQRTQLRRDLDEMYGKELKWTEVLNEAVAIARQAYIDIERAVDVNEIDYGLDMEETMLAPPLLPDNAPTIIFGDGGTAKSYVGDAICASIATGLPFAGFSMPDLVVMVIDYEANRATFGRRIARILAGMSLDRIPFGKLIYWNAQGIPLADQVEPIKRKAVRDGVGLIMIDSIGPACGGKPEDAEIALGYFRALSQIGLPSINIAHINRSGDKDRPFGSTFWHNEARRTWYVARSQDEGASRIDVGMYCKKVNDGPRPRPVALRIEFNDPGGPVEISRIDVASVAELQHERELHYQIYALLSEPKTIDELTTELESRRDTIRKALQRHKEMFDSVKLNGKMYYQRIERMANAQ